jgi:type IV pilus assembly protein PilW
MKKYVAEMTNKGGYTIVELMVAIAISGIFMGSIYSAYTSQQRATLGQEQVSAMQRNLRSAMYFMEKEIRMAGCDPTAKASALIKTAQNNGIRFTLDITDDTGSGSPDGDTADAGENIGYYLNGSDLFRDLTDDGDDTNGNRIAENIDALNFVYLDREGTRLDDGGGNVTDPENRDKIRLVQVTVVARTGKADPKYTDSAAYKNKIGDPIFTPPADALHFRRKLLSTSIKCRNLGL